MQKSNSYLARKSLTMILIVTGLEWSSLMGQKTSDLNGNSYEIVMHLSDDFNKSGDIEDLRSLVKLVPYDRFGTEAAGALKLLASRVTPREAESVIIPALIRGLGATNISIRREAAIALSSYSPYVAASVPALIKFLNSSQEADKLNVDYFVIRTIGDVGRGASSAIPTLLRIVDWQTNLDYLGDTSPRTAAVEAMDRIGFSDFTTRLCLEKALNDREAHVRYASACALIDNGFLSEAALTTLSRTIVTNDITFTLKPITLQLIRGATTNVDLSVQKSAGILLKKLGRN